MHEARRRYAAEIRRTENLGSSAVHRMLSGLVVLRQYAVRIQSPVLWRRLMPDGRCLPEEEGIDKASHEAKQQQQHYEHLSTTCAQITANDVFAHRLTSDRGKQTGLVWRD